MSPQFVDFNHDGQLDIVAGTFDGSPHVAFGTAKGWRQPQQILDRDGARIVVNQFWNFDTKKWDSTKRCDPKDGEFPNGHLTSAWATDWDADGDLDLLLGDHDAGYVYLRTNEGSASEPAFATHNTAVLAAGKPLCVPGTVATLRLIDWNGDGRLDLLCGSMGDAYSQGEGGGVYVYLDTNERGAPAFGPAAVLIPPSKKGGVEPTRPDSGLYMDAGDHDGDGDLDLVVGGYSQWTPPAPELTVAQRARMVELKAEQAELTAKSRAFYDELEQATKGLDEAAAEKKRTELLAAKKNELAVQGKRRAAVAEELEPLVPGAKRVSYVWWYENRTVRAGAGTDQRGGQK